MASSKKELISVFNETQRDAPGYCGSYNDSTLMHPHEVPEWSEITALGLEEYNRGPPSSDRPTILVVNEDTLNAAMDLDCNDGDVLVLNLASDLAPGGGVSSGAMAQEEELFRRTDYCCRINRGFYPLKGDSFIGTEGVTIFKDEDYKKIDDTRSFDFIAMPAVRKPILDYEDDGSSSYRDKADEDAMRRRINLILRFAVLENKTHLVLGALGCGAFRNPVCRVAEMFRDVLNEYGGYFEEVVFAVLVTDSKNSKENFETFSRIIPQTTQAETE